MKTLRRRRAALVILAALLFATVNVGPSAAARYEPIEVNVATFTVNASRFDPFDDGRLGIIIDAIGAGVVDCLDNTACADAGLSEVNVHQVLTATVDTATGRVRGQIVIDVISAGFSASFSGSVTGTTSRTADAGRWDLALLARARADGGAKATFELEGILERTASATRISDLRGLGLVSHEEGMEI